MCVLLFYFIFPTGTPIVTSVFCIRMYAWQIPVFVRVAKSDFGSRTITPTRAEAHSEVSDSIQHSQQSISHYSKLRFFIASVAMQVACDLIITTSMVCYLLKNRTSIPRFVRGISFPTINSLPRRTDSVLNALALYTISCGTLTACVYPPLQIPSHA
jgi:hypothetical protein